jgi:hypothetical protein
MPRFFFHVLDDLGCQDEEGRELADLEAAKAEAVKGARSLICGQVLEGRLALNHHIEIEDEAGNRVGDIAFRDAVRIED